MVASQACCTRPAAKAEYTAQGEWIEVDGLKTYHTGSSTASKAIFVIYDVFGLAPQTLQGADILAGVSSGKDDVQVFIPDLLEGQTAKPTWFAPEPAAEVLEERTKFFSGVGNPANSVERTPKIVSLLSQKYPSIKSWGTLGLCWGTKVVSFTAGQGSPFKAGAQVHPSFVDAKDGEGITIPLIVLPSMDEPADEIKKFEETIKSEKYFETFTDQVHGWMGARADLNDERNKAEYERGYGLVIDWFQKYLSTGNEHSASRPIRPASEARSQPTPTTPSTNIAHRERDHVSHVPVMSNPAGLSSQGLAPGIVQPAAGGSMPITQTIDDLVLDGPTIQSLHEIFFIEYAPFVPILDPATSPDDYYKSSPLLFWTIMTVASRRYSGHASLRHELAPRTTRLAAIAAVGGSSTTIHVAESLLILMTWWLPTTMSLQDLPFVLAGSLVHLAMYLGLHRPLRCQDYYRIKLYLTKEDLIRRSEIWIHTILLYQRLCIINGNFFYSTQDFSTDLTQVHDLWDNLPQELRYYSQLSSTTAHNLVVLATESQKVDEGSSSTLIEPLIRLADSQLSDYRPENPDIIDASFKVLHWHISRLMIYSHHLHDSPPEPTSTTLVLYDIACSVIRTLKSLQSSTPNFLSSITTYIFQTMIVACFTILKLLKSPSFASLVDVPSGETLFFYSLNLISSLSNVDNDVPFRVNRVLSQLWTSRRAFRSAQGDVPLGLRIRTRGALSIMYDCVWWSREEFGGQPNTYGAPGASTTTAPGAAAVPNTGGGGDGQQQHTGSANPNAGRDNHIPASTANATTLSEHQPVGAAGPISTLPAGTTAMDSDYARTTSLTDHMPADLGWDVFDDFLFLDQLPTLQP